MATKEEIKSIMKKIKGINYEKLNTDDFQTYGFGSRNFVELVVLLEITYDVEFEDEYLNLKKYQNIDHLVDYINGLLEEKE